MLDALNQDTALMVTIRESASGRFFEYQLRRKGPNGPVLSSDSFFTATPVGKTMIFYWDDTQKMLWFGTQKFVCSLPETALEKDKYIMDHPTKWSPTDWDTTGGWLDWDSKQMPYGGIPAPFLKEARQTLRP